MSSLRTKIPKVLRRTRLQKKDHLEPRLLSADEKRGLIRAHTAAREDRPTIGLAYYVGIAASCLVVVTGWWFTLGSNLRSPTPTTDSTTQQFVNNIQDLQDKLSTVRQSVPPSLSTKNISATFQAEVLKQAALQLKAVATSTRK